MLNLKDKIIELKKKKNAVILAHNYQNPEIQDIADFTGDSLGLSIKASKTKADIILFCGVHFMAETAVLASPSKKVILPDITAGCPMADMITADDLRKLKIQNLPADRHGPKSKVVCYVNSSAEVKAESDICCTSANSVDVVNSIKDTDEIIFVPDKYLGMYTQSKCPDKKFILWNGYCPTHARILPEYLEVAKANHPKAKVLVHPECRPEVIAQADEVLSTGGMIKFVQKAEAKEFIIATEINMLYALKKIAPDKIFYPATELATCPNMRKITLEKVIWSLEEEKTIVTVPQEIAVRAKRAVDAMLSI